MSELRENKNPFTIDGYLGRKWYFILGIAVAVANFILQLLLCSSILKEIFRLAKDLEPYSIVGILSSGQIAQREVISYVILFIIGLILSFINNKKRFTDLSGKENTAYIAAGITTVLAFSLTFVDTTSPIGMFLTLCTSIIAIIFLLVPGKYTKKEYNTPESNVEIHLETKSVVSFWRRWGAYIIDSVLILAVCSMFVGKMFPDFFFDLGPYSILFGFVLFVVYFGIMNSEITKGQTIGKLALGVKVVDKDGKYLSVGKSFLRAFILTLCLMMSGAMFNLNVSAFQSTNILYPAVVLFLGLTVVFESLFLFNFKTRQTLHDLLCGSYVVTSKNQYPLKDEKTSPTPIVFACLLGLFFGLCAYFPSAALLNSPVGQQYVETAKVVENKFNVKVKMITFLAAQKTPSDETIQTLRITVLSKNPKDEALANEIGKFILDLPEFKEASSVQVILQKIINPGNTTISDVKTYNVAK